MRCFRCQRNTRMNFKRHFGVSFECDVCKTIKFSEITYYTHGTSTTGRTLRRTYTEDENRMLLREETI